MKKALISNKNKTILVESIHSKESGLRDKFTLFTLEAFFKIKFEIRKKNPTKVYYSPGLYLFDEEDQEIIKSRNFYKDNIRYLEWKTEEEIYDLFLIWSILT